MLALITEGWRAVGDHLWETTVVLLVLLLLARALKSAPARFVHGLWLVGLLKLLVPTAALAALLGSLFARLSRVLGAGEFELVAVRAVRTALTPSDWQPLVGAGEGLAAHVPWLLTLGWVAGALSLLALWVRSAHAAVVRVAPLERSTGPVAEKLRQVARAAGIPETRIAIGEGRFTPRVAGLLRSRILISASLVAFLDADDLSAILLHEAAHVARRDGATALVSSLAQLLFFFYPPVWWLAARLRATAEVACDEAVIARGVSRDRYARALAATIAHGVGIPVPVHAAGLGRPGQIQQRLLRLATTGLRPAKRGRIAVVFGAALAASVLVPVAVTGGVGGRLDSSSNGERLVPGLDGLAGADRAAVLQPGSRPIAKIFDELAQTTGLRIEVEGPDRDCDIVELSPRPLHGLLGDLAARCMLAYEVLGPSHLLVRIPWIAGQGNVTSPRLIVESKVGPRYPEDASDAGAEGNVILQAVILRDGHVGAIGVLREVPGYPSFSDAAVAAVRQWRYEPALRDGEPVDSIFTVFLQFTIPDGEPDRS